MCMCLPKTFKENKHFYIPGTDYAPVNRWKSMHDEMVHGRPLVHACGAKNNACFLSLICILSRGSREGGKGTMHPRPPACKKLVKKKGPPKATANHCAQNERFITIAAYLGPMRAVISCFTAAPLWSFWKYNWSYRSQSTKSNHKAPLVALDFNISPYNSKHIAKWNSTKWKISMAGAWLHAKAWGVRQ